jgi:hypothetical protein
MKRRLVIDLASSTITRLEEAVRWLHNAGAPDTATVQVRVNVGWSTAGGTVRTVTASWEDAE